MNKITIDGIDYYTADEVQQYINLYNSILKQQQLESSLLQKELKETKAILGSILRKLNRTIRLGNTKTIFDRYVTLIEKVSYYCQKRKK